MFERIAAMLSEYLGIDESKITKEDDIVKDLGADSLTLVELLFKLEDEAGITIPDDQVDALTNVGALTDYIEKNAKKK